MNFGFRDLGFERALSGFRRVSILQDFQTCRCEQMGPLYGVSDPDRTGPLAQVPTGVTGLLCDAGKVKACSRETLKHAHPRP